MRKPNRTIPALLAALLLIQAPGYGAIGAQAAAVVAPANHCSGHAGTGAMADHGVQRQPAVTPVPPAVDPACCNGLLTCHSACSAGCAAIAEQASPIWLANSRSAFTPAVTPLPGTRPSGIFRPPI